MKKRFKRVLKKKNKLKEIVRSATDLLLEPPEEESHFHPEIEQEMKKQIEEEEKKVEVKEPVRDGAIDKPQYEFTMGDYPDDEMPYEIDPTGAVIEEFQKNYATTSPENKEHLADPIEKLEIRYLEETGALPNTPFKYSDPVRRKMKSIFLRKDN